MFKTIIPVSSDSQSLNVGDSCYECICSGNDQCLISQVTRPLSCTKRMFDVEEDDVDKLALK